ncbi:hypothetical protein ACGFIX_33880 [Nocardia salmonicida]|uniref:hypothetical protein n=1 Tax=Nocardia salmonicida TaxID=53431 RepID=UPI003710FD7B
MASRVWWLAGGSVAGGLMVWGALRFGVKQWLADADHPARPILEAVSWLGGIGGFLVAAIALIIAARQSGNTPGNQSAGPPASQIGNTITSNVELRDSRGVQVGDNNTQNNNFNS